MVVSCHGIIFSRNFFYGMHCVAKEWGKWAGYIIKNDFLTHV